MLDELDISIKNLLNQQIESYKNGNKKAISVILNLLKNDIAKLINTNNLTIKLTKNVLEDALKIEIKDDTFYKWVRKNVKKNSNNFDDVIIKNDTQISTPEPAPKVVEKEAPKVVEKQTKKEVKKDVENVERRRNVTEIMNDTKTKNELFNRYNKF